MGSKNRRKTDKDSERLAIELTGVSRSFNDNVALDNLDLAIPYNQITVLLGPNGAGKTTAIRTITGALATQAGTTRVFGMDPTEHGESVRSRCGIVSAKPALYDRLSGWDNLRYAAELYGLGKNSEVDVTITEAANRFDILDALDNKVGGYSTGMKTRLALARSILHEPELLLFDEPTSGLDPESAAAVLELIRTLTDRGNTVLMCTHHLVEAEGLADNIVMLESGHQLLAGRPKELSSQLWPTKQVRITSSPNNTQDELTTSISTIAQTLKQGIALREQQDHSVLLNIESEDLVPRVVADLVNSGIQIAKVEPIDHTLEQLYFEVRRRHANGQHEDRNSSGIPQQDLVGVQSS